MEARSHRIYELDSCPILAPEMSGALNAATKIAEILSPLEKPLDIVVTASLNGLDLDIHGCGKLDFEAQQALIAAAASLDLARIANHGVPLVERRAPEIADRPRPRDAAARRLPAGDGGRRRDSWPGLSLDAVGDAKRAADLYCGIGTFALRLAEKAEVYCVESDAGGARRRAARRTRGCRPSPRLRRGARPVRPPAAGGRTRARSTPSCSTRRAPARKSRRANSR